jgi:predicted ATP-grasp superfamily ATP-dependent carboligase
MKGSTAGPIEVLIVQGNNRQGLAVARSLARNGVSFAVVSDQHEGPVSHSRRLRHRHFLSPYPITQAAAFVGFLSETIHQFDVKLLIPASDQALVVLNNQRSGLPSQVTLAMASAQAVQRVLDKRLNLELASQVGVPCPRQFELQHPDQIPEMIRMLGFPIVMKPPNVPNHSDRPRFNFRVLFAHDEPELRKLIEEYCPAGRYPLFQECAVGEVHNLCCFAVGGELIAVHEYHSIRRREGVGVLRRIIAPRPDLVAHTRDLLRELDWDGVAHVAFFVSHDGQKKWYMETNGRFWGSTEGSVHAGWDFPYWVYRYFVHGETPVPGQIKIGSETCWHGGDLMALLEYYRGGDPPATGTNPGRVRATWQYLSGFSPGVHSDISRWTDPMPGIMEHWQLVNKSWRYVKRKLAGKVDPAETLPV